MELGMKLPDEIVRRLAQEEVDFAKHSIPGFSVTKRGTLLEARSTQGRIEVRASEDGDSFGLEGYAALWDVEYDVLGGPPIGWTEVIRREALTSPLAQEPDIRFLIDHTGIPLARTTSGTLVASADDVGFKSVVESLDMRNPDAQRVRSAVERGDIDQMSWAFRISPDGQIWNEDYTHRQITGVKRVFDQSLVTFPANEATFMGRKEKTTKKGGLSPALARALLEIG